MLAGCVSTVKEISTSQRIAIRFKNVSRCLSCAAGRASLSRYASPGRIRFGSGLGPWPLTALGPVAPAGPRGLSYRSKQSRALAASIPKGTRITDQEPPALPVTHHAFLGDWNHTVSLVRERRVCN